MRGSGGRHEAGIRDGRTALCQGEEGGAGPAQRGGGGAHRGEAVAMPAGGIPAVRDRGAIARRSEVSEGTRYGGRCAGSGPLCFADLSEKDGAAGVGPSTNHLQEALLRTVRDGSSTFTGL